MNGCARTAWLELGGHPNLLLEDGTQGYFCSSFDLGSPVGREVMDNRPDQDGADDRTKYMGPRTVTVEVDAQVGAGARLDAVASLFAPYMVPAMRPKLHYVLDRPGAAERVLTLRPVNYDWPVDDPATRKIALQWIAADPVAYDPATHTTTSYAGSSAASGRIYSLVFPRFYPASGGTGNAATISTAGDVPVYPVLTIYGPITAFVLAFTIPVGTSGVYSPQLAAVPGYTIAAGHFLVIDTRAKTLMYDGDPAQPAGSALNWAASTWPVIPPGPRTSTMYLSGSATTNNTQCVATWADGYLS